MATSKAAAPFYAAVGARDLAVDAVRKATAQLQTQLGEVRDLPKQVSRQVTQQLSQVETRLEELQGELKTLPKQVSHQVSQQAETRFNEFVAELQPLVARGEALVSRVLGEKRLEDITARLKRTEAQAEEVVREVAAHVEKRAAAAAREAQGAEVVAEVKVTRKPAAKKTPSAAARSTAAKKPAAAAAKKAPAAKKAAAKKA